jgi:hypothetical protein
MKTITLTTPQRTQATANKTALATAQAAYVAALETHLSYLRSVAAAGSPPVLTTGRVQLSDDGTTIIIG